MRCVGRSGHKYRICVVPRDYPCPSDGPGRRHELDRRTSLLRSLGHSCSGGAVRVGPLCRSSAPKQPFCFRPDWEDLAAGRLVRLLPDWSPAPIALHLATRGASSNPGHGNHSVPGPTVSRGALGPAQRRRANPGRCKTRLMLRVPNCARLRTPRYMVRHQQT